MADAIPVTFKDNSIDLPACKAIDLLAIMPTMELTPNQVQALIRAMDGDDTPGVQAAREELLAVAEPLGSGGSPGIPFRL